MPRPRRHGSLSAFIKGLSLSLGGVALVLVAGVAASWPLWYLATKHPAAYLLALAGGVLALMLRSAHGRKKRAMYDAAAR